MDMTTQSNQKMPQNVSRLQVTRHNLDKMKGEFEKVLPSNISSDKFIRFVVTTLQHDLKLVNDSDPNTLMSEVMKAAQDGLLLDGREAALTRFWNKNKGTNDVKYMPMIGGVLKKMRNTGEFKSFDSFLVFENDEYDYYVDENGPHMKFRPARKERGEHYLTVAYASTKDGQFFIEEMDMDQMKAVEMSSKGKGNSPWDGSFRSEMMKKSVMRRLSKRLPSSSDMDIVIRRDDELYDFGEPEEKEPAPEKEKTKTPMGLKEKLKARGDIVDVEPELVVEPEPADEKDLPI